MHDVCVIGHVTKDVQRLGGRVAQEMAGGTVTYSGIALRRLGLDTAIVTKAAPDDADGVLGALREAGATPYLRKSPTTTVFENTYSGDDLEERRQVVRSVADAFDARDRGTVIANVIHLGPLTSGEMPAAFLAAVSKGADRVSLDVQGFVRGVEDGSVNRVDWPGKREGLGHVDVLKANLAEAQILTGEDDPARAARALAEFGPREVMVTMDGRGSIILAEGRLHSIPAYPPQALVDPTGCGDSYCAGYIYYRLRSDDIAAAGRFAAAVATLNLERQGPFAGDAEAVHDLLRSVKAV
jgi:sugar/nucleoside kinase (ribokinase family)